MNTARVYWSEHKHPRTDTTLVRATCNFDGKEWGLECVAVNFKFGMVKQHLREVIQQDLSKLGVGKVRIVDDDFTVMVAEAFL